MTKNDQQTPDMFHIYVPQNGGRLYLAEDGTFVPDWKNGRAFTTWEDAFAKLDELIGDRDLGNDEPGIVRNVWQWI